MSAETAKKQDLRSTIYRIVSEIAEIPEFEITDSSRVGIDLQIGQHPIGIVEFLELLVLIQKECGVHISDEVIREMRDNPEKLSGLTVGELIRFVEKLS
jgi:hypothetical protein